MALTKRSTVIQIAIAAAAFVVGTALGHWITVSDEPAKSLVKAEATSHPSASAQPQSVELAPAAGASSQNSDSTSKPAASKKSLAQIVKGANSGNRTKELEEFAKNIASSEIGDALKQLRQMPDGSARELALRLLIARWTETDPEAALQFASQNRDFDYIASDVFQQLAADDFQSALARAQGIADPNMRYQALRGVLSFMADQDPLGALRLAGTLGSFPNNEPLSQVIFRQWSAVDPQAAAAAAAAQDPSGAGGWRSPVGQVLRNWASQDPMAAIAWSTSLTDAATQARDIAQIVRQWSRDDFNAAANWVNTLPAGGVRDAAAASLAFSLSSTDPSAAVGWALSIADAGQRDNALQRLSREVMFRNPTNGAALLQAAGVPPNLIPPASDPGQGRGRRGR